MNRGFSLIELLVVIAIIGVLSTVVLISISSARNRSSDASVKENLHTVRNQAELRYANSWNYGTAVAVQGTALTDGPAYNAVGANFFISDQQANSALDVAIDEGDAGYYAIGVNGQTWAVAVRMKAVTGYWCVDTTGAAKVVSSGALGGGTVAAVCP